ARVFAAFPDARFDEARHFVAGNRGVSEWVFRGTRADGSRLEVNGCDLFTFAGGKIALKSAYFKTRASAGGRSCLGRKRRPDGRWSTSRPAASRPTASSPSR